MAHASKKNRKKKARRTLPVLNQSIEDPCLEGVQSLAQDSSKVPLAVLAPSTVKKV